MSVPHSNERAIPAYLEEFIQNDPNFVPHILTNDLEYAFLEMHRADSYSSELK